MSPTRGCGATFSAANLAVSLSRVATCRTLLIDFNLRAPGVGAAFGLRSNVDAQSYFTGALPMASYLVRYCGNLALGLAEQPVAAPAELIHDPRTGEALSALQKRLRPDVTLYDLPPVLEYDDASAFLRFVDGVLLVADATTTIGSQIVECERAIADQSKLLGVVLNRSRERGGATRGCKRA